MKILIITYNCNPNSINLIKNESTLYLFTPPLKKIWQCKYVDFTDNINEYVAKSIIRYKNQYDIIITLDNQKFREVDISRIVLFKKNIEKWYIFGNKIVENNIESFDLNEMFINSSLIPEEELNYLYPSKEGDINFPYYSRIIYKNYDKCFENKSLGIKAKVCENILV